MVHKKHQQVDFCSQKKKALRNASGWGRNQERVWGWDQVGRGWRERVQRETAGIWEHLWDKPETQSNGNSQECIRPQTTLITITLLD